MKTYKGYTPEVTLKKNKSDFPKVQLTNSEDTVKFIRNFYHDDISIYESMFLLMLNRASTTIGFAKISQGGIAGTCVDMRIIAKYAIESLSSGVIICHNHPSGNLTPSNADKQITEKIKKTLSIFECHLHDHIILTEEGYYSFADEGFLL
jgi:DNA repair protein RadC